MFRTSLISLFSQSLTNVSSSSCPTLQSPASTTHVGTHPVRPAGAKRSASTAYAGTHNFNGSCSRTEVAPFPKPNAVPMVNFGQPKSNGPSPIATADSDLMHHQFRLSLLQWNPGPARNPTNIVSAACDHAVILQEASDHVSHISDYFRAYTDNTDLAILLNKDTFEPDPFVLSFKVDSTSKNTWGMVLLIVRALLRRPSLSGTPTVTSCPVHIHNVVAKKRDASTELLQFLHAKMLEYNIDFIGGDFNMSAFSTVSDVFSDPEFSAPGHSCLWGLGALDEQHRREAVASNRWAPHPPDAHGRTHQSQVGRDQRGAGALDQDGSLHLVQEQARMEQRSEQPRLKLRSRSAAEQICNESSRPEKVAAGDSLEESADAMVAAECARKSWTVDSRRTPPGKGIKRLMATPTFRLGFDEAT